MQSSAPTIGFFEKYLTLWVLLGIGAGIGLGYVAQSPVQSIARWTISTVNIPVALLVWCMIYPMMVQIDFSSVKDWPKNARGLGLTLAVNWLVKPFTMALFAYVFFFHLYAAWMAPAVAEQYLAGAILLGAAPCTAMVFVWSYLTRGDANYTLVQVALNDLILLVAFIPIVSLLFTLFGIPFNHEGRIAIGIPYPALITAVVVFVVLPLAAGYLSNRLIVRRKGEKWLKQVFLPKLKPLSIGALLTTLVLLFAFQGERIVQNPLVILWIAIPLALQTYVVFFLSWFAGKWVRLPHRICSPSAMIGASNFFELAVAVAIAVFGLESGASLATVVGVLIEVPVMLSLVAFSNRKRY